MDPNCNNLSHWQHLIMTPNEILMLLLFWDITHIYLPFGTPPLLKKNRRAFKIAIVLIHSK